MSDALDRGSTWTYFEQKYACSGICNSAMFFYSLGTDVGVPQQTCLVGVKEEIGNNLTFLGVTSIIASLLVLVLWILQYALWQKEAG